MFQENSSAKVRDEARRIAGKAEKKRRSGDFDGHVYVGM
jgi:hypothetical protein